MSTLTKPRPERSGRQGRRTIREIAQFAGVSTATVSRVVNGTGYVSPQTRTIVERVVREHGYTANRSARGLSAGRTGLVGVTLPRIHPSYFAVLVGGVADAAYERDMRIVLCPTLHEHDREVSLLERLMHGTTDCGLLVLPEESSRELRTLMDHGFRFVVIDPRTSLDRRVPTVSAAHGSGAAQVMQHLLGLGHRRIAAITGPSGWMASTKRLRAYNAALTAAGVALDPSLVIEADFEVPGGRSAGRRLLDLPEPPTAIFAFNDLLAIGAIQAGVERGLSVPDDFSVVGFDDTIAAELVSPGLTTVHQPLDEMGRLGFELVLRLLSGEPIRTRRIEVATHLVVRGSTAPPPRG